MKKYQIDWVQGSSPLTRGKRQKRRDDAIDRRLIPAHAGKTARRTHQSRRRPAHPRSRGENRQKTLSLSATLGSSPLTRGKHRRQAQRPGRAGLIPAHAGKTTTNTRIRKTLRAHPRSRGENTQVGMEPPGGAGSSPLTRGKHQVRRRLRDRLGLIPAHAGKTRTARARPSSAGAHPRSRGENGKS